MHYPGDYGFLPSTIAADGDPLDALVLVESLTFTGCVIEARAVGMLAMVDQGVEDLKLLCVSTKYPRQETVKNYSDVHPHRLREIEHFLESTKSSKESKRKREAGEVRKRRGESSWWRANDSRKTEVRGQKSEVRSQKSEVRSQRSEVRGQKSEVRGQRSEVRGQKADRSDF